MKALAQTLFEISCTQDFQILFCKGHNSEKGHNFDMKKNKGQLFFHEESVYENSKPYHSPFKSFKFHRKVVESIKISKIPYFCQNLTKSSEKLIRSSTPRPDTVYQI